mmetsp:Transcript_52917/g.123867  ORF Transcript_52917/g.123867 Transcript_52917/m.123867 type:complete len:284 (+) Transcript_52917:116-967(+)
MDWSRFWSAWKPELIYTSVLLAYAGVLDLWKPSIPRFFIQQDPSISNPYQSSTVNTPLLGLLACVLPVCVASAMRMYGFFGSAPQEPILLALGLVHVTQWAVTCTLKGLVGRLRPNFFALCNYCGYREALKSGDFTEYNTCAPAGVPGSYDKCLESLAAGRVSFPSGHSSTAFAGLGFVGLLMAAAARRAGSPPMVQVLAAAPAFCMAAWIATTRVQDSWHFESDILAGSIIGLCSLLFVFYHRVWPLVLSAREAQTEAQQDSDSAVVGAQLSESSTLSAGDA